ncbi:MAG: MFS transporter [Halobacteriales archaeon]|nr:MFS transporter [Halobacteriales archaeon]
MDDDELRFGSLYLTRFANSFGYITVLTLLPTYIDLLDPSGLEIGLFVASLGLARFVGIVPLAWAGDRYDKRSLLIAALVLSVGAYALFPFVESSLGFIAARSLQGLGLLGVGLLGLALVGDLAPGGERANHIGKYNAARMAAGIGGTLGAGVLYDAYGFGPIFALVAGLLAIATVQRPYVCPPEPRNLSV